MLSFWRWIFHHLLEEYYFSHHTFMSFIGHCPHTQQVLSILHLHYLFKSLVLPKSVSSVITPCLEKHLIWLPPSRLEPVWSTGSALRQSSSEKLHLEGCRLLAGTESGWSCVNMRKKVATDRGEVSSVTQSCPILETPWTAAYHAPLSITNSQSLPKFMFFESVMPSNHLIFRYPLLLLPSIFPSIRVYSNQSVLRIRWSKYWSFSFSISPSKEHPGLISFRMDWLDLLAVQGTLKSHFQHTSKASILWCSAFFIVQL